MTRNRMIAVALMIAGLILVLVACGGAEPETVEVEVEVTREVEVEVTREVEVETIVEVGPTYLIPFAAEWEGSPHADAESEAFRHWDEDGEVEAACAKCHSNDGYLDFLGADGSEFGVVDAAAPLGSTVTCETCHNSAAIMMDTVAFPSGAEISGLGHEAVCMQCHQGRASGVTVDTVLEEAGVTDDDAVVEELGFINIHYFAAAVSQFGTEVHGGYQYEGMTYDAKTDHVEGYNTCTGCHDVHTLELKLDECTVCHEGADNVEALRDLRSVGSLVDYDGDGDTDEGVYYEIQGLQEALYAEMQAYAANTIGTPIAYSSAAYPYWFIDGNGDGEAGEDEANFGNRYVTWTARLEKAAYNYQTSLKDGGAYAHGGKYIIQLLYDSIADLGGDVSAFTRIDAGHFAGSEEAFRHWDAEGEVPGSCAKCHSGSGLPLFLKDGVNISVEPSNGLVCSTCHDSVVDFTQYVVDSVEFPSGANLTFGEGESANLCMQCHQGRASGSSVDAAVGDLGADEVSDSLRFINIHYFAAGATVFGSEAGGMYEYAGNTYAGYFNHADGRFASCTSCHGVHSLEVDYAECADCHGVEASSAGAMTVRADEDTVDYDGDGEVEGLAGEIETMADKVYEALVAYTAATAEAPIIYDDHSYPYFFTDLNADGEGTPDEINYGSRYTQFTPTSLKAAYNYQYSQKDPGAFAHNGRYVLQVLYDTLVDLGGNTTGMTRP